MVAENQLPKQHHNKGKLWGTPFQKGQSGNLNGRPKKEQTLINILENLLKEQIAFERGGQPVSMGTAEAVVRRWIADCIRGEHPARKELLDRLYGKVPQPIVGGGEGNEPIDIRVIEVVKDYGNSSV